MCACLCMCEKGREGDKKRGREGRERERERGRERERKPSHFLEFVARQMKHPQVCEEGDVREHV